MIFGSVCSGIEAASAAWLPIGWRCAFMSEIETFPRAVLGHHYPETPLHGDFTTIRAGEYDAIDALVGGTPCQSFSVAGLRGGLADERGNLALEYLRLAERLRPRWLVWENVPGVLSSGAGRDFGAFVGGLAELGYGWAYRVLDAQYFGLAQRRKRVFLVGYLGDWRRAAAVLFEPASLRWHPAPRREAGKGIAPTIESGVNRTGGTRPPGTTVDTCESLITGSLTGNGDAHSGFKDELGLVAMSLNAHGGSGRMDGESETFVIQNAQATKGQNGLGITDNGPMFTLDGRSQHAVAHSLRGEGFDASEDGTGRGTPLVAAFQDRFRGDDGRGYDRPPPVTDDLVGALETVKPWNVAFNFEHGLAPHGSLEASDTAPALGQSEYKGHSAVLTTGVRRLTPRECERLQGFQDDYTLIPYRGRPASDGPRYRALGNSMAVPVMAWIGRRMERIP